MDRQAESIIDLFKLVYSASLYFVISLPLFFAYQDGTFHTNANPWRRYEYPALPLSEFILVFLFFFLLAFLLTKKSLVYGTLLCLPSLAVVYFITGSTRGGVIFLQSMNFLVATEIFRMILPKKLKKNVLYLAIVIGFLTVAALKVYFDYVEVGRPLGRHFYSIKYIIYNYFDYFPWLYFFIGFFSIKYGVLKLEKYAYKNMLIFILMIPFLIFSFFLAQATYSRLIEVFYYIFPILLLFPIFKQSRPFKADKYAFLLFVALFFIFIASYLSMLFVFQEQIMAREHSMGYRANIVSHVFENLDLKWILFPIGSGFDLHLIKSMHLEYLQIYTWLGLPFFIWFYYVLIRKVEFIRRKDISSALLIFAIIVLGGGIQLNLLQSYSGILIASVIAGLMNVKMPECRIVPHVDNPFFIPMKLSKNIYNKMKKLYKPFNKR